MAERRCPTVASSKKQQVFVALEDVSGTLQRPTAEGFLYPAGRATLKQTPTYTDSEELTGHVDVIDQFKNAMPPGEISIPMIVRIPKDGGKMQGHALFEALVGQAQNPGVVTAAASARGATIPAGIDAAATTIPYDGASGALPDSGTITIGAEKIAYTLKTASELQGCVRAQDGTMAAAHDDDATITLTVTATVNNSANITEDATEIDYDGASGAFPSEGTISIGAEKISYTGVTPTQFTGCVRGADGTAAATHHDDEAITLTVTAAVNKPQGTLAGHVPADSATIPIKNVSGGFFPGRGVAAINAEKIRYTDVVRGPGGFVTALAGCVRGFAGTTAAEIGDGDTVTLNSRVYFQDICRPTLSVWVKDDHTVRFASGAVVTQVTIPQSKEGGQHADFSLQFRKMGWCGSSLLKSAPVGAELSVVTDGGDSASGAYTEGGIIKNATRNDDNGGAGYTVIAVDDENGTITVSPAPSGWLEDDRIEPWLPSATERGEALTAASARVFISGKSGKLTEGSLTINTPTSFTSEIGDEYPGENADGMRSITMTNGMYFRRKDAVEFKRSYDGDEVPVSVVLGGKHGETLSLLMPRVKMQMPSVDENDTFVVLNREGAALGTVGNDSLYIIQE